MESLLSFLQGAVILVGVIVLIRDSLIRQNGGKLCVSSFPFPAVGGEETQPWKEGELQMLTATLTFIAM